MAQDGLVWGGVVGVSGRGGLGHSNLAGRDELDVRFLRLYGIVLRLYGIVLDCMESYGIVWDCMGLYWVGVRRIVMGRVGDLSANLPRQVGEEGKLEPAISNSERTELPPKDASRISVSTGSTRVQSLASAKLEDFSVPTW